MEDQRLAQRTAQIVPWIADPFTHFYHHEHEHKQIPGTDKDGIAAPEEVEDTRSEVIQEIIEAEEAAPLELFYDLFFVANLTTVTAVHYVVDYESLVSYILFFIILWFTWLQTTLYDIRFAVDSVYERAAKIVHFGVMIGFAATTLAWNPLDPKLPNAVINLRAMGLTLVASRFAFGLQYGVAAGFSFKHQRKGLIPLIIHSVSMFGAAGGYLGIYYSFRHQHTKSYQIWYAIIALELVAVLGSSTLWKVIGFKRTHLVERMGLLTLIIIGEGIIVMLKAVNVVEKGSSYVYGVAWRASSFSIVTASIGIIYGFYMFYFDYTPRGVHYGSIRQQFWTVLHFPFHLALVLSVEGLRQLTTYWSYHESMMTVERRWTTSMLELGDTKDPNSMMKVMLDETTTYFKYLYDEGTSMLVVKEYPRIQGYIKSLSEINYSNMSKADDDTFNKSGYFLEYYLARGQAEFYGIKLPKAKTPTVAGADATLEIEDLYSLVFRCFFFAVGGVFLIYGIMGLFVRRKKDAWDYFSVILRFATGATLIAVQRIQTNDKLYERFINSPWPIPTVCIIMFFTLTVDKAVGLYAYRRLKSKIALGRLN